MRGSLVAGRGSGRRDGGRGGRRGGRGRAAAGGRWRAWCLHAAVVVEREQEQRTDEGTIRLAATGQSHLLCGAHHSAPSQIHPVRPLASLVHRFLPDSVLQASLCPPRRPPSPRLSLSARFPAQGRPWGPTPASRLAPTTPSAKTSSRWSSATSAERVGRVTRLRSVSLFCGQLSPRPLLCHLRRKLTLACRSAVRSGELPTASLSTVTYRPPIVLPQLARMPPCPPIGFV